MTAVMILMMTELPNTIAVSSSTFGDFLVDSFIKLVIDLLALIDWID